jgi:hypothetical protein
MEFMHVDNVIKAKVSKYDIRLGRVINKFWLNS